MPQPERRETRERITEVLALTGQPPPIGRRFPRTWLGSEDLNCSISEDGTQYFCFSTGTGGDGLTLYCEITGATIPQGFAALEAARLRSPSRRLTRAEIAEQRQMLAAEDRRRIDAADFKRGLDAELDRLKIQALDSGDDEGLEAAASLQFRLSQQPEDVMSQMLATDGARVRGLIELARDDRGNAAQITARIVGMLACAELERERAEGLHCAA